jgi:hypothetical protein
MSELRKGVEKGRFDRKPGERLGKFIEVSLPIFCRFTRGFRPKFRRTLPANFPDPLPTTHFAGTKYKTLAAGGGI